MVVIESALSGKTKDYCERCMACFREDLFEMINYDVRVMQHLEDINPEKVARLMNTVRIISQMNNDDQTTISLAYPTMNI